jgi:ApaG protein
VARLFVQNAVVEIGHSLKAYSMAESSKHRIDVSVKTAYLADQSAPEMQRYVFAYTITIANTGTVPAQLLTRHWIITDANNRTAALPRAWHAL